MRKVTVSLQFASPRTAPALCAALAVDAPLCAANVRVADAHTLALELAAPDTALLKKQLNAYHKALGTALAVVEAFAPEN